MGMKMQDVQPPFLSVVFRISLGLKELRNASTMQKEASPLKMFVGHGIKEIGGRRKGKIGNDRGKG